MKLGLFLFRDSLEHIPSSLARAVTEILPPDHSFPFMKEILRKEFPFVTDDGLSLITTKLPFPYTLMSGYHALDIPLTQLVAKDFDSDLSLSHGTDADVEQVLSLARTFRLTSLRDLNRLYNITDTAFLTEAVVCFSNQAHTSYKLHPLHFISTSSYSLNVALYSSRLTLLLPTDPSQTEFLRQAIRGGYAGVSTRYAKAKPHSLDPNHCPTYDKEEDAVLFLDWNGLYANAMCFGLPNGPYEWLDKDSLADFFHKLTSSDGPRLPNGYSFNSLDQPQTEARRSVLLEVDLHFVESEIGHHLLNHFPPIFESRTVQWDELSASTQRLFGSSKRYDPTVKKLIADLHPKYNYIIYLDVLVDGMRSKGVVLDKIHRGLAFEQIPYFRGYIEKLMWTRKTATSSLVNMQAKLCKQFVGRNRAILGMAALMLLYFSVANSLYGKTIQDSTKYIRSSVYTTESSLDTRLNFDLLRNMTIIDNHLIVCHSAQRKVMCTSSLATGVVVLELAKLYITSLYYHLQESLNRVELLVTDTDSVCVLFRTKNFAEDVLRNVLHFCDTSNIDSSNPLYSDRFKSDFNRVKIETGSRMVDTVYALKAKSYAISFYNDSFQKLTNKGIPRAVMKAQLTIDDFEKALHTSDELRIKFMSIVARKHLLTTRLMEKSALNLRDTKRFVLRCSLHSRAFGHYRNQKFGDRCLQCEPLCPESPDDFP